MNDQQHPTTQFLDRKDGKIAFDDQGKGQLIICMPAGGDTRAEYRFLTPILVGAGYRVVTMDIRGQGETSARWRDYSYEAMASDVVALIERLQAGPAIVVGTSKAAGVAVVAATDRPELVSKVVMMGPFARTKSPIMSALTAQILLSPLWGLRLFAGWYNDKMYPIKPADYAEQTARMRAMLREPGRMYALRTMFSDSGQSLDGRLAKLAQPTLIIMGEKDPDFPSPAKEAAEYPKRMHATTPKIFISAGAGHHPQAQKPEEVGDAILTFIS
ncbi:MAG: alpha/beta fold hydrolase [Candidatus Saccharibacteria bacterium]